LSVTLFDKGSVDARTGIAHQGGVTTARPVKAGAPPMKNEPGAGP
jgi:hypothetical protein